MAITTESGLIAARTAARPTNVYKATLTAVAAFIYSTWRSAGPFPAQGAIPTTAEICTKATLGALANFTNPTSPAKTYLDVLDIGSTVAGAHVIYDRLAHMGGLSGTVTTAQTVNLTLPTNPNRCDQNGYGVEWYLEWYTATGSTAVTATITYTDQDGNTGNTTTLSLPASVPASRCYLIGANGLAAGDTAIKSIQSVQLSATTGTAGNFGVTARRRIASMVTLSAGVAEPKQQSLLIEIPDDACLEITNECTTSSTGNITGEIVLIQG